MEPELKAKWLEALKSDKYTKGKGCLRDKDNKFCCLGVLADVIDPAKWEREDQKWSYDICYGYLPGHLAMELGLKIYDGEDNSEVLNHQARLATINDSMLTFQPAIDYIEVNL